MKIEDLETLKTFQKQLETKFVDKGESLEKTKTFIKIFQKKINTIFYNTPGVKQYHKIKESRTDLGIVYRECDRILMAESNSIADRALENLNKRLNSIINTNISEIPSNEEKKKKKSNFFAKLFSKK
jgi:hypothetical protein